MYICLNKETDITIRLKNCSSKKSLKKLAQFKNYPYVCIIIITERVAVPTRRTHFTLEQTLDKMSRERKTLIKLD